MAESVDVLVVGGDEIMAEVDTKKNIITERLNKRDEERVQDIHKRKEEKENLSAANESVEYFGMNFNKTRDLVESRIEQSDSMEKVELADHFDSLAASVHTMQKFLTDSTMFLPSYAVQRAQGEITKLQISIQEKREKLIPKKKFAFKSKKKTIEKPAEIKKADAPKKLIKFAITDCSFADLSSQSLVKTREEATNKDVALTRLRECTVKIYGSPSATHINKLVNCKVLLGPVSGSVFIDECENCEFVVSCQQLRIHSTKNTDFYIHVTSRAIIEDCSTVYFAPYNWTYDSIDSDYEISGLDRNRNSWDDVDDFNWLASDQHSPNWAVLAEDKRNKSWDI